MILFFPVSFLGCGDTRFQDRIVQEILRSSAGTFVSTIIFWTLILGTVGLILSVLVAYIVSQFGPSRAGRRKGKAFRFLVLAAMAGIFFLFFGAIGFFEGIYRGSAKTLTQGDIARQFYPAIGGVGADAVAAVYLAPNRMSAAATGSQDLLRQIPWGRLEAFRRGEWELDIPAFLQTLDRRRRETTMALIQTMAERSQQISPDLESGMGESLLRFCMKGIGTWMMDEASDEVDDWRIPGLTLAGTLERLNRAGRYQGDPNRVSHGELSAFVVDTIFVRPLLFCIKPVVRGWQVTLLIPVFLALVFSVGVLWVVDRVG